ncbi:MAG: hypothetical protein V2I54_04065 [Bacteroidales bacterium]|jgi:hypothetical protein|nr:hypothetical protein [Bacteroidales bacterium]
MKKNARRLLSNFYPLIILFILLFFLGSCEDEDSTNHPDPAIQIIDHPDFVSGDTTLAPGEKFTIAIQAEYNGYDRLTNFIAKLNDERYLDLGIYAETYRKEIEITKGLESIDNWEFIIRDRKGNFAQTALTVTKDENVEYGEIDVFKNIQLGAQNSPDYGSFLSLTDGSVYNLEEAYSYSSLIDIVSYYDDFDKLDKWIMASPGANIGDEAFPGEFAITNWDTTNTTRYSAAPLTISVEDFDAAQNDSLLLAHSFAFESGKRKAKDLAPGDIYSFVRDERTGMFKVIGTTGESSGNIIVDIIIQK